ncbi:sugar fermentation stimulation protein A [Hypnocyclicus thermotrophus]|uniref:Sugar fermentation stimulation protein homolog n=1 Tax=Hypnocyclicus thermotrophus TaxID=1627895 RepID=A0AA46I528_9FUSO|nr:DNA/RNA nuclease SfsA [Hypnocyclicus thermotrophus]TDT68042.1 sugar fermentation stimulation protein A [Hypnocyclicus thermotrophus]
MKKILNIPIDKKGIFLERPNRYLSKVKIDNEIIEAHVHDPGRLKELLFENNKVYLQKAINPNRKTKWDVIAADSGDGEKILINSKFHRYISEKILNDFEISPFGKIDSIKAEVKYKNSRIDYLLEKGNKKIWVEVKGVSLSQDKIAKFPDAPTKRGQKHLKELIELKKTGDRTAIMFLILRNSIKFRPKYETDKEFAKLFYLAKEKGVEIYPILLEYKDKWIYYKKLIDIAEIDEVEKEKE